MAQKIRIKRTQVSDNPPAVLQPGELSVEMNDPTRLWVGVPDTIDPTGKKLLIDVDAIQASVAAISEAPPATPDPGALWYENDTGILWLYYVDANTSQWVQVNGISVSGSGIPVGDVSGPLTATPGHIAKFADTSGKIIMDGGPAPVGDVIGPAGSTTNNLAVFDGATGKLLKDGGPPPSSFPAGTYMLFFQSAAPVGWTKGTAWNDKAIRIVTGTSGGSSFGSHPFSTVFNRTATDGTTITSTTMGVAAVGIFTSSSLSAPPGAVSGLNPWGKNGSYIDNGYYITAANNNEGVNAGGAAHSHTMDMRVSYVDAIACYKN